MSDGERGWVKVVCDQISMSAARWKWRQGAGTRRLEHRVRLAVKLQHVYFRLKQTFGRIVYIRTAVHMKAAMLGLVCTITHVRFMPARRLAILGAGGSGGQDILLPPTVWVSAIKAAGHAKWTRGGQLLCWLQLEA